MKPNFALSLAQDGIRLLHRAADGWQPVGVADFNDDDLADQLRGLREAASAIDPDRMRSKVVIPNDQIKYLTLPFGGESEESATSVAEAALEGATPYALDDLVFDTYASGQILQVAAVARETLAEAAEFAKQNEFNPISFVADPCAEDFESEPFFADAGQVLGQEGLDASAIRDTLPVSRDLDVSNAAIPEPPETIEDDVDGSFVSRRRVPTFRTEPKEEVFNPNMADASGFEEQSATYEPYLSRDASRLTAQRSRKLPDEAQRMTVFGARDGSPLAGRRDRLTRVVAVVVIVSLGIAGFASGALNKTWNMVFNRPAPAAPELRFAAPLQPNTPAPRAMEPAVLPQEDAPARDAMLSDEDVAVLDALTTPSADLPDADAIATPLPPAPKPGPDDVLAYYALYGIWPQAPDVPRPSALVDLNDFYISGIDKDQPQFDAVALPPLTSYQHDEALLPPANPVPAGTRFTLDRNGLVLPTPKGSLNPDGIPVIAGLPPARPPDTLVRIETPGDDLERRQRLAPYRPIARPDDLVEQDDGSGLDAARRAELASLRPRMRPASAQEETLAAASLVALNADGALIRDAVETDIVAPNARAVRVSLRPDARPSNINDIVARAQRNAQPAASTTTARVAPRTVIPSIPSSASTAREATERNAINLRRINLIGVYGTPSSRRALVRLGNGRYQKVAVGDRIDGGRVSAIGDSELRYQKSGRAIVLKMPSG